MPCFFSSRVTTAVFYLLGNDPDCRDRLIILVIAGKTPGSMFLNNTLDVGSSSHDLYLVLKIIFFT